MFKLHSAQIDLVLLDLQMPRMSGREVLARLKDLDPQVKVALFTDSASEREVFERIEGIVRKPLELDHLFDAIREALNR